MSPYLIQTFSAQTDFSQITTVKQNKGEVYREHIIIHMDQYSGEELWTDGYNRR